MSRASWDELLTSVLRSSDNIDFQSVSTAIRGLPNNYASDVLIRNAFQGLDTPAWATLFRSLDLDVVQRIARGLDPKVVDNILKFAPDLSSKMGRTAGTTINGTVLDRALLDELDTVINSAKFFNVRGADMSGPINTLRNLDDAADENLIRQSIRSSDARFANLTDAEIDEVVDGMSKVLKSSDEGKEAMSALGFLKESWGNFATWVAKNWYKLGAFLFLLCLMYNTENPFEALRRALQDAGQFVRGLKEIADNAAKGAKNTFDFLTWIAQNPIVSLASSAACGMMAVGLAMSSIK